MNNKNYYLIGDCHSTKILKQYIEDKSDFGNLSFKVFGKGGFSIAAFKKWSSKPNFHTDRVGGFKNTFGDAKSWVENIPLMRFSEIVDSPSSVIVIFLGYIDIKNIIPSENSNEKANLYISNFFLELRERFPTSEIKIIEPMPQFKISLYRKEEPWPLYSYEERKSANSDFLINLRRMAEENSIEIILTQPEILELFECDIDNIGEEYSFLHDNNLTDNFTEDIYKGLWEKIKISLHIS